METIFYSLHDFYVHSKSVTYICMGLGLIGLLGWWLFLTGRDATTIRDETIRKH